jgi:phosphohistidine phosphatase
MDLFILRHGEAGKHSTSLDDYKRSLTNLGRKEMEKIGQSLKKFGIEFDHVFTSSLPRSIETTEIILKYVKSKKNDKLDELRPEGNKLLLYQKLSKLKRDSTVLLVGHEPYLSDMISETISGTLNCKIDLKKAGLARINVISFSPKMTGELRWLLTPKLLKKMT